MDYMYPWSEKECRDAYSDVILKIAMSAYAQIDGEALLLENEKSQLDPELQMPPEKLRELERLLARERRKANVASLRRSLYAITTRVAVVFFAVFIVLSSAVVASADLRKAIYSLLIETTERYTQITPSKDKSAFIDPDVYSWPGAFAPTYLPPGYVLDETFGVITGPISHTSIYRNGDLKILISQASAGDLLEVRIDTENADIVQTILINESFAQLVVKNGRTTIVWSVGDTVLEVSTTDTTEAAIEVASNIYVIR